MRSHPLFISLEHDSCETTLIEDELEAVEVFERRESGWLHFDHDYLIRMR
jgi:hypothetical protein